jgi:glycerophosphoryl diester phosphodiesterase
MRHRKAWLVLPYILIILLLTGCMKTIPFAYQTQSQNLLYRTVNHTMRNIMNSLSKLMAAASESANKDDAAEGQKTAPRLIAHAGGDIHGVRMTNSLQALDSSYDEGFCFIEVDICLTSDGVPVLAHDWGNANWFAGIKYSTEQPGYEEFIKRTGIMGIEFMDLNKLALWLSEHDGAYIVTDIKQDNIEVLRHIKESYPEASKRIIPQIYSIDEYEPVRDLGYDQVILTLYKIKIIGDEIFEFCSRKPLFGLTMSQSRADSELLEKFSALGIPIYVHTINDYNEYIKLRDKGVYGVYTDFFQPSDWVE